MASYKVLVASLSGFSTGPQFKRWSMVSSDVFLTNGHSFLHVYPCPRRRRLKFRSSSFDVAVDPDATLYDVERLVQQGIDGRIVASGTD